MVSIGTEREPRCRIRKNRCMNTTRMAYAYSAGSMVPRTPGGECGYRPNCASRLNRRPSTVNDRYRDDVSVDNGQRAAASLGHGLRQGPAAASEADPALAGALGFVHRLIGII